MRREQGTRGVSVDIKRRARARKPRASHPQPAHLFKEDAMKQGGGGPPAAQVNSHGGVAGRRCAGGCRRGGGGGRLGRACGGGGATDALRPALLAQGAADQQESAEGGRAEATGS